VYACVDLEIQAPTGFQVNTDMDAGWRPTYVEGDLTVLDDDGRVKIIEYHDGPLRIVQTLVRLCKQGELQNSRSYQRLAALIQLGASGRTAHRQAITKLSDEILGILEERLGDDPVLSFRIKDAVKRYAD
jgi:hypothetical protein